MVTPDRRVVSGCAKPGDGEPLVDAAPDVRSHDELAAWLRAHESRSGSGGLNNNALGFRAFANLSAPNDGVAARYIPQIPRESPAGHQVSQKSDLPAVRHHITALPVLAPGGTQGRSYPQHDLRTARATASTQAGARTDSAVGRSLIHPLSAPASCSQEAPHPCDDSYLYQNRSPLKVRTGRPRSSRA